MKAGDRIECIRAGHARIYKKRGVINSVSPALVTIQLDGEDFQFTLMHSDVHVLTAVELLAELVE